MFYFKNCEEEFESRKVNNNSLTKNNNTNVDRAQCSQLLSIIRQSNDYRVLHTSYAFLRGLQVSEDDAKQN